MLRSRVGRALVAVRENELAAAALAIPTARVITLAFAWSGLIVGAALLATEPELLRAWPGTEEMLFGALLVVVYENTMR